LSVEGSDDTVTVDRIGNDPTSGGGGGVKDWGSGEIGNSLGEAGKEVEADGTGSTN